MALSDHSKTLTLLLLVAFSVASVGVAEVAIRFLWPASDGFDLRPPNRVSHFYPAPRYMPGVSGQAVTQTIDWGIRADPFPEDTTANQILAIGGSTTANLYLDTEETWTDLVQEGLRANRPGRSVWVGNAGLSGASARDHVLHMKYLVPQVPGLDGVIVLAGVNDMTSALGADPYQRPAPITDPQAEAERLKRAFARRPGKLHQANTSIGQGMPLYKRTAIYELVRRARGKLAARRSLLVQDVYGGAFETWRQHRRDAVRFIDVLPPLDDALAEYRFNLEQIVTLARASRLRLLFITQPALLRADLTEAAESLLWLGGIGNFQEESGLPYYTAAAMREALDRFNAGMLDVCRDMDVECFDLSDVLPRTTNVFHDDVHYNEEGSRQVAVLVAEYMLTHGWADTGTDGATQPSS